MELDPLAIRNLLIWIALALGNTIFLGATPNWMRCGAKRADPSAASALFALVFAGASAAFLALTGGAGAFLTLSVKQYLTLAACGLLSALTWLSLFTAMTGGRVNKVIPVYLLGSVFTLTASHFLFGAPMGLWKICCLVILLLGIVFIESSSKNLGGQLWFVYALIAALAYTGTALLRRGLLGDAFERNAVSGRAFRCRLRISLDLRVSSRQAEHTGRFEPARLGRRFVCRAELCGKFCLQLLCVAARGYQRACAHWNPGVCVCDAVFAHLSKGKTTRFGGVRHGARAARPVRDTHGIIGVVHGKALRFRS